MSDASLVFFCLWISWFLDLFWHQNCWLECRICSCSDWRMLENQSANLCLYFSSKEFLKAIFFLFRRRLSRSNRSFIVYHKRSLPTPFTLWTLTSHCTQPSHKRNNWANCQVCKKPAYHKRSIYPCDYAGYQNALWFTHSQTVYTNGLDNVWVGCNAGYVYLVQPLSDFLQTKTLNQFKKVDFHSCMFTEWSHYNKHLWKLAVLG